MIRPECFLPWNGGFEPPTPDEIREYLRVHNLTGAQAAEIVGVDSRTVRRWIGGDRAMPYAAWRLLVEAMDRPLAQAAEEACRTIVDLTDMLEEVLQTQELTPECREEVERCLRENYTRAARRKLQLAAQAAGEKSPSSTAI